MCTSGGGRKRKQSPLLRKESEGLVQGKGVIQREIACPGADEAGQVRAGAQRFAEVAGKGADVCAFGAGDAYRRRGEAHA